MLDFYEQLIDKMNDDVQRELIKTNIEIQKVVRYAKITGKTEHEVWLIVMKVLEKRRCNR